MHLLLKCIKDYELTYTFLLQYILCKENNLVICDSFLHTKDVTFGFGINIYTREYGLFPFDKFELVDMTNLINYTLFKVIKNIQIQNSEGGEVVNTPGIFHRNKLCSSGAALLCSVCGEVAMGTRTEFAHCQVCNQLFHVLCWKNHTASRMCHRNLRFPTNYITDDIRDAEMAISDWTSDQVIQWLCSINFYRLIDLFELKKIDGNALLKMMPENGDQPPNSFWSLITDKFYRESLSDALESLMRKPAVSVDQYHINADVAQQNFNSRVFVKPCDKDARDLKSYIFANAGHHLREVTFLVRTTCSYCESVILGLQKQGLHCVICREDFHKTCGSQLNIQPCPDDIDFDDPDVLDSTVFGIPLHDQISDQDGVPIFLRSCIEELEGRYTTARSPEAGAAAASSVVSSVGLRNSLLESYSKTAETVDLVQLQDKFSHPQFSENGSQLTQIASLSDSMLAKLIKLFFKELPEPLLSFGFYHSLVCAVANDNDNHTACSLIHCIIDMLPDTNLAVLKYLTEHFQRICQASSTSIPVASKSWACIFSKTLLWPPHIISYQMGNAKNQHQRLVQLLFEHKLALLDRFPVRRPSCLQLTDENPYIEKGDFARVPSMPGNLEDPGESCAGGDDSIDSQDWYWSDITKEEVNELMAALPDGYFMVRDCSDKKLGEYTLTIRKDGENKLIRIIQRDSRFGFQEPCRFTTVTALVRYYNVNKLTEYNDQLNLTLRTPLSKSRSNELGGRQLVNDRYSGRMLQGQLGDKTDAASTSGSIIQEQDSFSNLGDRELLEALSRAMEEYNDLNQSVEKGSVEHDEHQHRLDEVTKRLKGIDRIQTWCKMHSEHIMNMIQSNAYMKNHSRMCLGVLNKKLNSCAKFIQESNDYRDHLTVSINTLQKKLSTDRPNLKKLNRRQQQIVRHAKDRGFTEDMFSNTEKIDVDKLLKEFHKQPRVRPIEDPRNWYFENITREISNNMINDTPHGTFLIRKRPDGDSFTLDIRVQNRTEHCLIHRNGNRFGFVQDKMLFNSLEEVVREFHTQSLEIYNSRLQASLLYPIGISLSPDCVHGTLPS